MPELETLARICAELDIPLDDEIRDRLNTFRSLLLDYNQHTNLTAIRDPDDVEVKLLADSLVLLQPIIAEMLREGRETLRIIDVGTGAGFPGLPLAIANPALQITLVDATRKKVTFIEHVAESLRLTNVIPIHGRSEDLAHQNEHREQYDVVTARALAAMPALVELTLPFLRIGGLALLTKGRDSESEIRSANRALDLLGGDLFDNWHPEHPALSNTSIVQVRKFKPSPKKYPRSPGTPAHNPII